MDCFRELADICRSGSNNTNGTSAAEVKTIGFLELAKHVNEQGTVSSSASYRQPMLTLTEQGG